MSIKSFGAHGMSVDAEKLVIVDTDPGVDDAMAMLFLHASPSVRLHSITTVFGNAEIETTTKNAAYLANRFGIEAPIVGGASRPITRKRFVPDLKVHGGDGLGDTGVALTHSLPENTIDAANHIVKTINQNPGKVTILAIAPLTNLALALKIDPEIANLVHEVVIMGGAFGGNGRSGNIRTHAEANVFYDPEAADLVLQTNWPVTIIGLDVTLDCILSSEAAADIGRNGGEAGAFLWTISRGYEEIYRKLDGIDGCCVHDVAAAAYVVEPSWFETDVCPVRVELNGEAVGQTIEDSESGGRPSHKICRAVDGDSVVSAFVTAIKSYAQHPENRRILSSAK